jgi:hypothetical protein
MGCRNLVCTLRTIAHISWQIYIVSSQCYYIANKYPLQ